MSGAWDSQSGAKVLSLVSIIVPVCNEDDVILEFNRRLTVVRQQLSTRSELIFVNDGSSDNTLALLSALKEADATIGIVDLSRNFGKEVAVTAGLDQAHGDVVIIMDADLQHPPELIPKFIDRWRQENADVVYGQRASRPGEGAVRKVTSRAFYRLLNALTHRLIPIDVTDFCLLSRRAVGALPGVRERHRFMKGLFGWIGYRQVIMLYEPDLRFAGVSKWNYWRLWNFSIEGITSFSIGPLKVATYVGVGTATVSIIYGFYTVIKTIIFGNPVPGYPSLLVLILLLGGLQLIFLGIIGEYLGRMFNEVKQRPLYLIKVWQPPVWDSEIKPEISIKQDERKGC